MGSRALKDDKNEALTERSVAIIKGACQRLLDAKYEAERRRGSSWMSDPQYKQAEQAYDAVMDIIPEWAQARRMAKEDSLKADEGEPECSQDRSR